MRYQIESITRIENGFLYFYDEKTERAISLKVSADRWWEIHHKHRFGDGIFRRKKKNRYAGIKEFAGTGEIRYFKLYDEREEYCFEASLKETGLQKLLPVLQDINERIRLQGYWLYDWA